MKDSYERWDRGTPERFVFDILVRRSQAAVVDHWDTILEIIATNAEHDKDYELRMDMMNLLEHFLLEKSLHSTICFYTEIMIKLILLPCTEWRAGMPNVKIRKAAVICLMKLVEQELIEKDKLVGLFTEILNKMKSPLDDEWGNDLRFASVVFLKVLLQYLQPVLGYQELQEIYPELLKRLDDAQDGIRVETAKCFELFFDAMKDPWSSSLYDYTVKQVFIHLDDPSMEIQ
jgi:dynein assembly factor 5, axonemal